MKGKGLIRDEKQMSTFQETGNWGTIPGPSIVAWMSVMSSSLVNTLIPSGGSLDKLVSSFATCLMIWGWRFSTFELVWNSHSLTQISCCKQQSATRGMKKTYRGHLRQLRKPKRKKQQQKSPSRNGTEKFVFSLRGRERLRCTVVGLLFH